MAESQENIRSSLMSTLSFLASEAQQQEFASKVYYGCYQGEIACWWFDTFFPDEPSATEMFTVKQLISLRAFSTAFDTCLESLGYEQMTIQQLQAHPEWKLLVLKAKTTLSELEKEI
jgi:hypothetical protein